MAIKQSDEASHPERAAIFLNNVNMYSDWLMVEAKQGFQISQCPD